MGNLVLSSVAFSSVSAGHRAAGRDCLEICVECDASVRCDLVEDDAHSLKCLRVMKAVSNSISNRWSRY